MTTTRSKSKRSISELEDSEATEELNETQLKSSSKTSNKSLKQTENDVDELFDSVSSKKSTKVESKSSSSNKSNLNPLIKIGNDQVPAFGFGTLALGVTYPDESKRPNKKHSIEIIHALLDAGVRFIDTADTYCVDGKDLHYVETVIAEALKTYNNGKGAPSDVFIATKGGMARNGATSRSWWPGGNSREAVHKQISASYEALGRRRIDLWQIHHVHGTKDKLIPKTLIAMKAAKEMVDKGLVKYIGLCNASVAQMQACLDENIPIVSLQCQFSLFEQAPSLPLKSLSHTTSPRGVIEFCQKNNIAIIAYSPLGGLKVRRGERSVIQFDAIPSVAKKLNCSPQALTLAMMVEKFKLIPITGARNKEHALDATQGAAALLTDGKLNVSSSDRAALNAVWKAK